MSDDLIGRGVVEVVGNTDDVTAKIAKVGDDLEKMARRASKSGKDASDGIKQIGEGLKQSSDEASDATKKFEANLKKLISATGGAKRGTTEYLREQAKLKGADSKVLEPLFRQYESVRRGAAAAAAETRKFAESQRFLRGLDAQANSIGKTASQLAALKAEQLGVAKEAAPMIAKMQAAERAANSTGGAFSRLSGYVKATVAAFGVREIVRYADSWTELQNRLRLVTDSQEGLAAATDDVYRIAKTTNQELSATGEIYQRFAQNANALGISQQKVAEVTETVSKAVAISGASAQAAQAALTQFGQALASGVLRGEEFNSVMEQTPGLAQAIARGMGVAVGELRALAADGKITADVLIEALTNAKDSVDEQFNTRVVTLSQSFTNLRTSVARYIGELNTSTGVTSTFGKAIELLADNIKLIGTAATAAAAIFAGRFIASIFSSVTAWGAATIAAARYQVELARVASSSAAASVAMTALSRAGSVALGVLGGPVGLLVTAGLTAAAFVTMSRDGTATKAMLDQLTGSADDAAEAFRKLGALSRQAALDSLAAKQAEEARAASKAWSDFVGDLEPTTARGTRAVAQMRADMRAEVQAIAADTSLSTNEMQQAISSLIGTWVENGRITEAQADAYRTAAAGATELQGAAHRTGQRIVELSAAARELEGAAHGAAGGINALNQAMFSDAGTKYLATLQGQIKSLQDGGDPIKAASRWILEHADATEADKTAIMSAAHALKALQDARQKATKSTKASTSALSEAAKAAEAFRKEQDQSLHAQLASVSAIHEQAQALEDQALLYGASKTALEDLTIARLEEQAAILRGFDGSQEQVEAIEREIEARRRLRTAIGSMEQKEAERAAWEDWARDVEQIFDRVGQSLTDAIFDGGKSGKDLLRDLFKGLTFNVLINPVMRQMQGWVTNAMGPMFGHQSPTQTGVGGMMGAVQGVQGLWSALSGGLTSTLGSGIASLGNALGSTTLQSFAAGMQGSTLAAGLAGPTTAGAGGAMGLGALAGKALPWVGVGLMAYSLLKDAFDGETRFGAGYTISQDTGGAAVRTGGPSGGDPSADQTMAAIKRTYDAATSLASALGGSMANLQFGAGLEISPEKGRSFVWSDWAGAEGVSHERGMLDLSGVTDGNVVAQEFSVELQRSILRGLQMADLDEAIAGYLSKINVDALDEAGVQAEIANLTAIVGLRDALSSLPFAPATAATFAFAEALAAAAGGADNAAAMMASFYQNYYSEAERAAWLTEQLTAQFAELGYTLPRSREEMRDLVQANLALGEAGAQTVASLLSMEAALSTLLPAFDAVTDAFGAQLDGLKALATETNRLLGLRNRAGTALDRIDRALGGVGGFGVAREAELWAALAAGSYEQQIELASELTNIVLDRYQSEIEAAERLRDIGRSLRDYVQSLLISDLSPLTMGEQLAEAARQYNDLLGRAQGGDQDAMGRLQGAADAYLQLARDYYASSDAYTKVFGYVTGSLDALGVQAETDAQRQLGISESTLAELESLRSVAERAYGALDRQYAQSLQALQAETALLTSIGADTGRLHDIAGLLAGLPAELAAKLQPFLNSAASGVVGSWYADAGFTDPVGLDYWSGQLQQKPQEQVRKDYLYSMVGNWYRDHLGWMPDTKALEYWTSEIERIGIQAALDDWKRTAGIHGSHRNGLWEVPFDGYRAELHRGETVLPKEEAAQYRANTLNWSQYGQSSALVEEIRALRAEVASLRAERKEGDAKIVGTVAASAQASAREIAEGVAEAVQTNNWRQENQLRYGSAR